MTKRSKPKLKRGSKYETTRKISVAGIYSYYVTIPKDYIDELDWEVGDTVTVKCEGQKIVISRRKLSQAGGQAKARGRSAAKGK